MDQKTLCDALRAAGFSLFDREPYGAKNCAQANLSGRTHFADDATLHFFHSRIVSARILCMGAAFLIIESSAKDYANTSREFRFALFDVTGECVGRPKLGEGFRTKDAALRAFWSWYGSFDLPGHYAEKLTRDAAHQKTRAAKLAKHAGSLARAVAKAKKVSAA